MAADNVVVVSMILRMRPEVDVNAVDSIGRSALIRFASKDARFGLLLLQMRAEDIDVNLADSEGETALMIAIQRAKEQCLP